MMGADYSLRYHPHRSVRRKDVAGLTSIILREGTNHSTYLGYAHCFLVSHHTLGQAQVQKHTTSKRS